MADFANSRNAIRFRQIGNHRCRRVDVPCAHLADR